jgi:hypothetical protein
MNYPAACREFVIPAEAGIQRARLDSPVSSTGQACQARNDGPEQKTLPHSKPRGSSLQRVLKGRCLFITTPVFRHGVFLQPQCGRNLFIGLTDWLGTPTYSLLFRIK